MRYLLEDLLRGLACTMAFRFSTRPLGKSVAQGSRRREQRNESFWGKLAVLAGWRHCLAAGMLADVSWFARQFAKLLFAVVGSKCN